MVYLKIIVIMFATVNITTAQWTPFPFYTGSGGSHRSPHKYYFKNTGNNANTGLDSSSNAWADVGALNNFTAVAGDTFLFKGGQTFTGQAYVSFRCNWTSNWILMSSYGGSRATITLGSGATISLVGTKNIIIKNLNFEGSYDWIANTGGTINDKGFQLNGRGNYIIDSISVTKLRGYAFYAAGLTNSNLVIKNSVFFNNGLGVIYAQFITRRDSIIIRNNHIYNFSGDPAVSFGGSTIGFSGGHGLLVERNLIHNSGILSPSGPALVYTFDWSDVHIRYNEIYGVHCANGATDGDCIDLDEDTDSSIVEYNYLHNADGNGVLIGVNSDYNLIRYNVIKNCGLKNSNAGVYCYGNNNDIYGNTIVSTKINTYFPFSLFLGGSSADSNKVRDNIFCADSVGSFIVHGTGQVDNVLQGNCYYSSTNYYRFLWSGVFYTSFSAWQTATGQEKVSGVNVSVVSDPLLNVNFALRDTINNAYMIDTLTNYKLQALSPCINAGVNPQNNVWNTATVDFFANAVPNGFYDIGVYEKP